MNKYSDLSKDKVLIVAEFTNNHCGDMDKIYEMIDIAKSIGIDLVKFQKRDVLTFYPQEQLESPYKSPFGETFKDYRLGVELEEKQFNQIDKYCKEIGIPWFASALDIKSVDFLNNYDTPFIKIPGTVSYDTELYRYIAKLDNKDIVLSTGGCSLLNVIYMVDMMKEKDTVFLLQTSSSYPPDINRINIGVISYFKNELSKIYTNIIPGYSSHEIELDVTSIAVACGARMIEKHFTLNDTNWIHFSNVAYKPDKMKQMVESIRRTESIVGSQFKYKDKSENHKYEFRKS